MGFFIGWVYFEDSERYSDRYYRELELQRHQEGNRQIANEKKRRRAAEARKRKRAEIKRQQAEEADMYQQMALNQYGAQDSFDNFNGNGDQHSSERGDKYKQEIMRRYGQLYNSYTDGDAPQVDRGFGSGPHQSVKREQKYAHHAPTGPLARRMRIPLGREQFNPNQDERGGNQHNPKSGGGAGGQGGGGGKLNRPF